MNNLVITDSDKCIGCGACEVACALAHPIGTESEETLSPVNFKSRIKVVKGPRMTTTAQCRQCDNAPCVNVCPTNALIYSKNSVQLIEERCIACKSCAVACPFGVIEMVSVPVKQQNLGAVAAPLSVTLAYKCDLCVGVAGGPACIPVCPTKALSLIEPGSLAAECAKKRKKYAFSLLPDALVA